MRWHEPISDDPYYEHILAARSLLDGREVHLRQMIFNLRLSTTVGPQALYYDQEFCFHDERLAWLAFETWDGDTDPFGWAKDATTGRIGPGFIETDRSRF